MKKFILTVALLASVNALALDASSSWEQINASYDYIVQAPFLGFGPKGAFNMCATADAIKSIEPVKTCTQWSEPSFSGDQYTPSECLKSEMTTMSVPRRGTHHVCTQWEQIGEGDAYAGFQCVKYADEAYEISLTQNLNVIYATGEMYPGLAFTKSFTIPSCQ